MWVGSGSGKKYVQNNFRIRTDLYRYHGYSDTVHLMRLLSICFWTCFPWINNFDHFVPGGDLFLPSLTLFDLVWFCLTLFYLVLLCFTLFDLVWPCLTSLVWPCLTSPAGREDWRPERRIPVSSTGTGRRNGEKNSARKTFLLRIGEHPLHWPTTGLLLQCCRVWRVLVPENIFKVWWRNPSVDNSDPRSGAFLTTGSGMEKKSGSEMNIPDQFSESSETVFRVKNT